EKLSRLNEISHAFIKKKTLSIIKRSRAPFLLIDAPLLFESGFDALCDVTVCGCLSYYLMKMRKKA
ncbi:MAG: dephospho-CoA kinase, partial [Clostridia bacterium]|nr:dephospho-CoA kinase [Clostridia bacterium]